MTAAASSPARDPRAGPALRIGPSLLVTGRADGPLKGWTAVVKDLLDVRGFTTGAGNPDWLADHDAADATAPAVQRLVDAGVDVIGKSHTDELAFSLSGTNVHYGTPDNPRAPGRIPGGSSSGSASAVARGEADLGVGTDTSGSIRVPAAYCGVFGWRPTHGRVPTERCVPLAPTFDTVGLLARDGQVLHDAALAMLATQPAHAPTRLVLATDLVQLADIDVARATREAAEQLATILGATLEARDVSEGRADAWSESFRARQQHEAWESHGAWITARRPRFGPGIAARFEAASRAKAVAARDTDDVRAEVRSRLALVLGRDGALVVPSAATVAPPVDLDERHKADLRTRTMTLTCVAGLAGAPALSLPTAVSSGLPAGACLVALPGADEALLAAGVAW